MKKYMQWIAIAALFLPIFARGLWFYRGIPSRPDIATPDYSALKIPQAPLETPPAEDANIKRASGTILLDYAHGNQYQQSEIQSLKDAIEKRGGSIEILTDTSLLKDKLKYARAYVVISPSYAFTADEANLAQKFSERGGRLVVFTDATRGIISTDFFTGATINYPDAAMVNPLLAPFGITVNNDYLYNVKQNDSNFRNVFFEDFGKHELTFGLKRVAFYGTHSLKTSSGAILLRGSNLTLSSIDDAHDSEKGGAVISADGNILAFGDFTFLTPAYQNAANNATLIDNIADFSLNGKQAAALANFPHLFTQRNLQIYPSAEIKLTAEMIASIAGLQASLPQYTIEIIEEAPREGDALILGTLTPSDDMKKILKPFNVTLDDGEFISVPKFGNVGRYGNGILLLESGKKGNKLTLLADTPEDLISLMDMLAGGSLDDCILQDNIGVCGVSFGGSYSDEDEGEAEATPEPSAETEATPVPEE